MAGFIGYCVQANGIHFPWAIQNDFIGKGLDTVTFGDIAAAGDDATPTSGTRSASRRSF